MQCGHKPGVNASSERLLLPWDTITWRAKLPFEFRNCEEVLGFEIQILKLCSHDYIEGKHLSLNSPQLRKSRVALPYSPPTAPIPTVKSPLFCWLQMSRAFWDSPQHKVPQLLSNSLFDAWSPKPHSIYYDDFLSCGAGFHLIIKKAPEQDHLWLWIKFCIKCIISFFPPWHMPLEHHAYTFKKCLNELLLKEENMKEGRKDGRKERQLGWACALWCIPM